MNKAICNATVRLWLKTPLILLSILFMFGLYFTNCVISYVSLQGVGHEGRWLELDDPLFLVVILGTGIIGRDLSNGVLALIFCRPLTRASYVFTKWIVLSLAASLISILQLSFVHGWFLIYDQAGLSNVAFLAQLATAVLSCIGVSSVIVLFSALRAGPFAGTGLWLMLYALAELMQNVGGQPAMDPGPRADPFVAAVFAIFNSIRPLLGVVGEPLRGFLVNNFKIAEALQDNAIHWTVISAYLLNTALALVLAVWIMNKKELSYGAQ